jgi:transposase
MTRDQGVVRWRAAVRSRGWRRSLTACRQRALRRKTAQALAWRSRIVLACAGGSSVSAVAGELGISRATAGKWRSRFLRERLEGLADEPRPGRHRTITDDHVEKVIITTLRQEPPGGTRCDLRECAIRNVPPDE